MDALEMANDLRQPQSDLIAHTDGHVPCSRLPSGFHATSRLGPVHL